MLYNLHLLRVIAALGVVYFHTTSVAGLGLDWDVGSRGVDVFFVISGFIIAYIGSSKPEEFFRRRLIRVVPFYWAATLVVFSVVTIMPHVFRTTTASVPHLVSSLLFIPREAPSGEMQPTLSLGWSLNFEMLFYVVFALALRASPRRAPLICVALLTGNVVIAHSLGVSQPILAFYARPIVLEFCYGIGVFYLFQWASARATRLRAVPGLQWLLVGLLVGNLIALNVFEELYRETVPRYLVAGIPAFFIVTSALLLEKLFGVASKNRLIFLLGEASYIVYLVHPYIVFTVLRVVVKDAHGLSSPALAGLIAGLLALTSAIAIAIHLMFEKPVMAYLRGALTGPAEGRLTAGETSGTNRPVGNQMQSS
jgi:exopolysaccharide production protein ExoZ